MKAVEELPNREGKLVIHDVKTVKVFAFLTWACSQKTTRTQMVNTICAKDGRERSV